MRTANITSLTAVLLTTFCFAARVASQECGISPDVSMRSIFSNYNYGGVGWAALSDPQNDVLLKAAMAGAVRREMALLGVDDLEERLRTLEAGNLIRQENGRYCLAFPVIASQTHAQLRSALGPVASDLLPAVQEMARKIRGGLKGQEQMLYHLLWSWMLDGRLAWMVLEAQLASLLQRESVNLATCWWLYPRHAYHVGTNSYSSASFGVLAISWSDSTAAPWDVRTVLGAHDNRFLLASIHQKQIPPDQITDQLRAYGFVDEAGRPSLFLLTPSSPLASVLLQSSARFARLATERMNVPDLADRLGLTPEQALVIAYHELCYELLARLHRAGDLWIPKIAKDNAQATRWLVSLLPITSEAQREHLEALGRDILGQYGPAEGAG